MHFASLIICTKNRAEKLRGTLKSVPDAGNHSESFEIVLVDNDSTDDTPAVIEEYAANSTYDVTHAKCTRPGLGNARNVGVEKSSGEWLLFTDDDCYLNEDYIFKIFDELNVDNFQYGSGQIKPFSHAADPRVARLMFDRRTIIPALQFIPTGLVQGANMFIHRSVFEKTGLFNPLMGAGTPFACEDIEMACRASFAGFCGVQIPELIVHHDHGRNLSSPEALETIEGYDVGRGAYYASMLLRSGFRDIFDVWKNNVNQDADSLLQLSRELEGASAYLKAAASERD